MLSFKLRVRIACFPHHVLFYHSLAEWTIPTVTGDIPPAIAYFSFTQISSDTAVMFGGETAESISSELYLATVGTDSVVLYVHENRAYALLLTN